MPGKNLGSKDITICQNVSNFDVRLIGDLNSFLKKRHTRLIRFQPEKWVYSIWRGGAFIDFFNL